MELYICAALISSVLTSIPGPVFPDPWASRTSGKVPTYEARTMNSGMENATASGGGSVQRATTNSLPTRPIEKKALPCRFTPAEKPRRCAYPISNHFINCTIFIHSSGPYFPSFHPRMHTAHNNDANGPFFYKGVYHIFMQQVKDGEEKEIDVF